MIGSRTARRYTALLVGVMAILCQTAAVANARPNGAAAPGTTTLQQAAPCHEMPENPMPANSAEPGRGDMRQDRCQADNAVTTTYDAEAFHADEAPLTVAIAGIQATDAGRAPARRLLPSRAESPPLRIVHCCLRN